MADINPVGEAQKVEQVDIVVASIIEQWQAEPVAQTKSWWSVNKEKLAKAVKYTVDALDQLIHTVQPMVIAGADKKAIVMTAIAVIYDAIVKDALPLWLSPIMVGVKGLIINFVISFAIDWIVNKYKTGNWSTPAPAPTV